MPAGHITFQVIDGDQAAAHLEELRALYSEVYAEPPYKWGDDHAALFAERFQAQRRQDGFALVEARDGPELAGAAFGVTLQPSTPWWHNLTTTLPAVITTEQPGRTFALVEMLVRAPWRRQHIAQAMHDLATGKPAGRTSHPDGLASSRARARCLPQVGLAQASPETQSATGITAVRRAHQATVSAPP